MTLEKQTEYTRHQTLNYLHLLADADWYTGLMIGDSYFNSISWLAAHIAVSQNFLQSYCIGREMVKIPWARQFGMGSQPSSREDSPSQEEILDTMEAVHLNALKNIRSLDTSELARENPLAFRPPSVEHVLSIEEVIHHSHWHEGHHSGQLALWAKALDKPTI